MPKVTHVQLHQSCLAEAGTCSSRRDQPCLSWSKGRDGEPRQFPLRQAGVGVTSLQPSQDTSKQAPPMFTRNGRPSSKLCSSPDSRAAEMATVGCCYGRQDTAGRLRACDLAQSQGGARCAAQPKREHTLRRQRLPPSLPSPGPDPPLPCPALPTPAPKGLPAESWPNLRPNYSSACPLKGKWEARRVYYVH